MAAALSGCATEPGAGDADDAPEATTQSAKTAASSNATSGSGSGNGSGTEAGSTTTASGGGESPTSSGAASGAESGDACSVAWSTIPDQIWVVGADVSLDLTPYLDGGDAAALGLTLQGEIPDGVTLDGAALSGAPTEAFGGELTATVDACDGVVSEAFSVDVVAETALAVAASGLEPGQSVGFTPNTLQLAQDIQWSVETIFYDAARKELQYMGKPASGQSTNYSHYIYEEATDTWGTSGQSLFPGTGHIWNLTFDPDQGDYWFRKYNTNRIRWFDRSEGASGTWKETAEQTSPALNSGNANFAAMGWHPNLFGAGNPGIFIWAVFRMFAYNPATQSFSVLSENFPSGSVYRNRGSGQALYIPETDQLLCFAGDDGNGHPAIVVEAGAGNSTDVLVDGLVDTTGSPPIEVYGGGGMNVHGHAVNHPSDANRVLMFDEHSSGRVWDSTDHGATWTLRDDWHHPFSEMQNWSAGEYTVGTGPYGVVIGMTSNGDGGETVLWKPND